MLLAHLTDIHVADAREYAAPGEERWHGKIRKHSERLLERLLADLAAQRPDHVVLTGDITQTAKESEFVRARAYLDGHAPGVRISAIPGNHDVWHEGAVHGRWFWRSFGDLARCDLGGEPFPYCHLLPDGVALLALDSSPFEPGDPSRRKGRVAKEQLSRLELLAGDPRLAGRFKIVVLHHHLRLSDEDARAADPKDPTPLEDAERVQRSVAAAGAGLVLHGHRHKQMRIELGFDGVRVPVLCPGSGTRVHEKPDRTARYGLYRLDRGGLHDARVRFVDPVTDEIRWG